MKVEVSSITVFHGPALCDTAGPRNLSRERDQRLERLMAQREDLASRLRQLFANIEQGRSLQKPQIGSA